jgi:hypothetical protein
MSTPSWGKMARADNCDFLLADPSRRALARDVAETRLVIP